MFCLKRWLVFHGLYFRSENSPRFYVSGYDEDGEISLGMFQILLGMFQSVMKTVKLDVLPDGGRKLRDEVLFLSENLRQLDIQINNKKAAQTGTVNWLSSRFVLTTRWLKKVLQPCLIANIFKGKPCLIVSFLAMTENINNEVNCTHFS